MTDSTIRDERLHDAAWMAEMLGGKKSVTWVMRHLDEIPHRQVGRTPMFHDDDYRAYVESVARQPDLMRITGRLPRGYKRRTA